MSSFNSAGEIDMSNGAIIDCIGKKRSGKSVMASLLMQSFPGDVIVIDPAGDDGPTGPDVVEWRGTVETLPGEFPEYARKQKGQRVILHYVPDPGSPTELQDMDAVVGVAMEHSTKDVPAMLVIHETGRVMPAGRTPPHVRRYLNHNRHRGLVGVNCMPRPKTVDPLVVTQADLLYVFTLPHPDDRKRIAEETGTDPRQLDDALDHLRPHGYLRIDTNWAEADATDEDDGPVTDWPGLPEDVVRMVKAWTENADRPAGTPQPAQNQPGTAPAATARRRGSFLRRGSIEPV